MQIQYKNKIIYDGKNSVSLSTENQVLTDNLIIFNDDTNTQIKVLTNDEEIASIGPSKIKKIITKGKWLTNDLDFNITSLNALEYYLVLNRTIINAETSPHTPLGACNTYLQDGDYIEFNFTPINLLNQKDSVLLWVGQPNTQNYYTSVDPNAYILKFVGDKREARTNYKIRIYGLTDEEEPSRAESRYNIWRTNDTQCILRITKDGFFIKKINEENFSKYDASTASTTELFLPTLLQQYNRNNNLLHFDIGDTETEDSYIINYLKLVLGESTKYNHNVIYNFSGISNPAQESISRGSAYTYNFPITSNQILKGKIFMSNFDVSDRFLSNNQINIPVVVGDLEIIADVLDKESFLKQNYSPNSSAWIDNTLIDFSAGGYVEAKIDLTNFNINKGNILSVGRNIDVFSAANSGTCIHLYFIKSSRTLNIRFRRNAVCSTSFQSVILPAKDDNTYVFRIDKNGVSVDGTYYHSSDSSTESGYQVNEDNALAGLFTLENDRHFSWQVGSAEGTNRSNAFYEYIKVVNVEEETN